MVYWPDDLEALYADLGEEVVYTPAALGVSNAVVPDDPGPYTVTITPPTGGVYAADAGVIGPDDMAFVQVDAVPGPETGEYSVNEATGVYTFAAADKTLAVEISYEYSFTALGLVNRPGTMVLGNDLIATDYGVRFITASLPAVRRGDAIAIGAEHYKAREDAQPLHDGFESHVPLATA